MAHFKGYTTYIYFVVLSITGPAATKGKIAQDHTAVPWNYDQEVLPTSTRRVLEGICKFIEENFSNKPRILTCCQELPHPSLLSNLRANS